MKIYFKAQLIQDINMYLKITYPVIYNKKNERKVFLTVDFNGQSWESWDRYVVVKHCY